MRDAAFKLRKSGVARTLRLQFNSGGWISISNRVLVLGALAGSIYLVAQHVFGVLERQNIATGFDFIWRPARFEIGETLIAFSAADTYGRALLAAILNTLQVGVIGCIFATILGVVVGVARLSDNPLLARLSGVYVEIFRNTPVLLQLFLWYAIFQTLPSVRESIEIFGSVFISQRGVQMPGLAIDDPYGVTLGLLAIAALGALAGWLAPGLARARSALMVVFALIGLWALAHFAGLVTLSLETPELAGFGFRGGMALSPEFLALVIGLVVYTAAFIAEIVRGGVEAIPVAQKEAAVSLGMTEGQAMRRVILPQSLRIVVPPLVSEYLNLVKNSSLAVAIGYPDIVWAASTIMNQTGQAIEGVLILTGVYLTLSVVTSLGLNAMTARRDLASAAGVRQTRVSLVGDHRAWPAGLRPIAPLFASPSRAVTSALVLAATAYALWGLSGWSIANAVWIGEGTDCRAASDGACWAFVAAKFRFFLFGLYPQDMHWRPAVTTTLLLTVLALSMSPRFWGPYLALVWGSAFATSLWLMGGGLGLANVSTASWGGLPVTLLLGASALMLALPLGVVLAVARNSAFPTARMLATIWIEVIRGVPLISILFLANTLLPLFLPGGGGIDKLLRAQIALTFFASAYLAEAVRAGLRATPLAQSEAALSLGLTGFTALRLVILPQALQTALPGIVNTAIAIFKDTSLITIIGLFDLLGAVRAAGRDPAWLGFEIEGYLFAGVIFFALCFAMSRFGLWLERRKPGRR
ncbi:MAG: ABC transporter permease subunit [Chitinophagales bacterium]|nr:ABC transporter permease subunit [Hyphomicrobiales bacterium]